MPYLWLTSSALDPVHIRHSTSFPTLCTLTVDGLALSSQSFPPPSNVSAYEWRLPTSDPRDEGGDFQRLHTLDIYFWTLDDANSFLDSVGRVLSPNQLKTDRPNVRSNSGNGMSTVVRQLEDVAVTDPAYQDGQTRNSRTEPVNTAPELQNVSSTLPPPPPGGPPTQTTTGTQPAEQQEPANLTPLPYNPAAPAAPEPIQHREKTPPPVDADGGTGLAAAAAADSGIYAQQVPERATFAPPPTQPVQYSTQGVPGTYASPPPSAGLTHSASLTSRSSVQTPPGMSSYQSPFPPSTTGQVNQPGPISFAPPPKDPNAHLYTQAHTQPPPHPQQAAPVPIGGYSTYSYDQQPPSQLPHAMTTPNEYDIHNQAYRPTEAEAASHYQKYAQQAMRNPNPGQRPRKLEDGAVRVENSVNKFLRKLEKRI